MGDRGPVAKPKTKRLHPSTGNNQQSGEKAYRMKEDTETVHRSIAKMYSNIESHLGWQEGKYPYGFIKCIMYRITHFSREDKLPIGTWGEQKNASPSIRMRKMKIKTTKMHSYFSKSDC